MSISVKNNVFWVGKIDWELRKFHGDEYSTHRGSTYNSFCSAMMRSGSTMHPSICSMTLLTKMSFLMSV
jgi:hypothetical protein